MSRAVPRFHRNNPSLPPAVPNLFEVIINGLVEGQQTINTFYYADGGAALLSNTESLICTGWVTTFGVGFKACISSDWAANGIKCQCLTTPSRMPFSGVFSGAGTGPAGHEPTTVCVTVARGSGIKGQSGRGRVSLPAVPTTWVTASQINGTGSGVLTTNVGFTIQGFTAGGVTYVAQIVSKKNKLGPLLGASPITTNVLRLTLGSCRRRKLGRGK